MTEYVKKYNFKKTAKCKYCNSEVIFGEKFCYKCGKEISEDLFMIEENSSLPVEDISTEAKLYCPMCHSKINQGDYFCQECGTDLRSITSVKEDSGNPVEMEASPAESEVGDNTEEILSEPVCSEAESIGKINSGCDEEGTIKETLENDIASTDNTGTDTNKESVVPVVSLNVDSIVVKCEECGGKIKKTDKYCKYCGSKKTISYMKSYCCYCGGKLDFDSKYCSECGNKVS